MLDLKLDRAPVPTTDAATIILVRDGASGVEVFCVERSKQSRFLGGAIVFPGGKLDSSDADPGWTVLTTTPRPPCPSAVPFANDEAHLRALSIAASRETLEEAAILLVTGDPRVPDVDLLALRERLKTEPAALRGFLEDRGEKLDLHALQPLARWITPVSETRRYDTRFFVAIAPPDQTGAHDEYETMASFWATPADVLRRWEAGEVRVAPPTHRTLDLLAFVPTAAGIIELARASCLDPICPLLVPHRVDGAEETLALTLPGDPDHDVADVRVPGSSRYVLRGDRWLPEPAPR